MKCFLNLSCRRSNILFFISLLIFIIIVALSSPLKMAFEYDTDEGSNLMGSLLYLKGFSLYSQIWSDQTPLFIVILSYWFKLFGLSVYHARILTLIFSGMLLWAFYQTINALKGSLPAIVATIFLILSAAYFALSVSVMIGIPSLALAMLSIYFAVRYGKLYSKHLLALSGIFMALSLQTKLFTAFLMPIIILEIIRVEQSHRLRNLFVWLMSFLVTFLGISIMFFKFDLSLFTHQLFLPHFTKINLPRNDFSIIWKMILQDYDIAIFALIGIILLIKHKKYSFFLPALWLISAFIILAKYRPIWHHYYLLISIPLSWLAGIGFSELSLQKRLVKRKSIGRVIASGLIILTILRIPIKYNRISNDIRGETTVEEHAIVKLISNYKGANRWIITDRPIFAFYAGMLVPPELTTVCFKRILTKNLTSDYLGSIMEKYKPGQILLARSNDFILEIPPHIQKNYSKIYENEILRRAQVSPVLRIHWLPEPLGNYLPSRMQIITDKWFYALVWHRLKIPVPKVSKIRSCPTSKTHVEIFIRKDILGEN